MKTRKDRRAKSAAGSGQEKSDYLEVRLSPDEKQAFRDAAGLAGLAISAWVRERLRQSARAELEKAGQPVAFLPRRT